LLLGEKMAAQNCPVVIPDMKVSLRLAGPNQTSIVPGKQPTLPIGSLARARTKRSGLTFLPGRLPNNRTSKPRVLVVDDVNDVTEMIGLFLKHAGYEVSTADSARAALRLAGERAFDLIISDIGMPAMNGYELAESLRSMPDYREIPMIAVTGYTEYDDHGRSLQAGFSAHMTKPIDPSQLLNLMNELLG
jgi:CheY-like chemotaxis protein